MIFVTFCHTMCDVKFVGGFGRDWGRVICSGVMFLVGIGGWVLLFVKRKTKTIRVMRAK